MSVIADYVRGPSEHRVGMRQAFERAQRDQLAPRDLVNLASRLRLIEPRNGFEPTFGLNKIERRQLAEALIASGGHKAGDHRLLGMSKRTWQEIVHQYAQQSRNGDDKPLDNAVSEREYAPKTPSAGPRPYSREEGYTKLSFDASSGDNPLTLDEAIELAWSECQDVPAYWNLGLSSEELQVAEFDRREIREGRVPMPTLADLLRCIERGGRVDGVLEAGRQLPMGEYELLLKAWRKAKRPDRPRIRRR